MGVKNIIRQEVTKVRLNSHLAQFVELGTNLGARIFQHFATLRVLGCFQLLENPLLGEDEPIAFPFFRELRGGQSRPGLIYRRNRLCLLVLDGLALPTSRHE
jgi:hypothetical protein